MTYLDLLLFVDEKQKTLEPGATRLLIHLIATAIRHRSNEVSISGQKLAKQMGAARDTVDKASRELAAAGIITVDTRRHPKKYVMPPEWFYFSPKVEVSPAQTVFIPSVQRCGHCNRDYWRYRNDWPAESFCSVQCAEATNTQQAPKSNGPNPWETFN